MFSGEARVCFSYRTTKVTADCCNSKNEVVQNQRKKKRKKNHITFVCFRSTTDRDLNLEFKHAETDRGQLLEETMRCSSASHYVAHGLMNARDKINVYICSE